MTGTISVLTDSAFRDTEGIVAAPAYTDGGYGNVANIAADLSYLGIDQIRLGLSDGVSPDTGSDNGSAPLSTYETLAADGDRFTIVFSGGGSISASQISFDETIINQFAAANPGSIIAVEGLNEINNNTPTFDGLTGEAAADAVQQVIYNFVQDDPLLTGVGVDYYTGYDTAGFAAGPDPATAPGLATDDNQHPYPPAGQAPAYWVSPAVALGNEGGTLGAYGPVVYTETGYSATATNADVQAVYSLDLLMDDAKNGISQTYLYQLMNAYAPGSPQGDDGYGLFNSYDDQNTPSQAATAIHNLNVILTDPDPTANFTPIMLPFSIAGLPSTGDSLDIETSAGFQNLVIWNEPQIWNNGTETVPPPTSVTLQFDTTYQTVEVFNPLVSASAIETLQNVSSVQLSLLDSPLIVQIEPNLAAAPATVTAPPAQTLTAAATTGGTDTLVLDVAGIAASGTNAQFTVSVDGTQIGGVQTVTAAQVAGGGQDITLTGNFGPAGPQTVTVTYLDGFTGAAADAGRTLYVDAVSLDGLTIFPNSTLLFDGSTSYSLQKSATPVVSDAGSADTLVVNLSEAAASGHDVLFMVSVDGQLVGGIQTVTASEAAGQSQNLTLTGDFGSGAHTVTIDFLNGFSGNPADAGRALYVNAITLDGLTTTENAAQMNVGAVNYTVTSGVATTAPKVTITAQVLADDTGASATDGITSDGEVTLTGTVTGEDGTTVEIYNGVTALGEADVSNGGWSFTTKLAAGTYALYALATDPAGDTATSAAAATITVETTPPSVAFTTPAQTLTASGTTAAIVLTGTVSAAAGTVVQILDGTTLLGTATLNGDTWSYDASLAIGSHNLSAVATDPAGNTTSTVDEITVDAAAAATTGGTDTLVLDVAGIAASGTNAQFTVSVDGTQIGGVQTVTAAQVAGGGQDITLTGNFGPAGPQTVTVTYLDGFTGAAADAGRTLYVDAVSLDGLTIFPNSTLLFDGSTSYSLQKSATPVVSDAGSADTLVVNLSEAAASGHDVLFMVSVDGQLVGGIQTVTASEAAGQSQNLTLTGDFGSGAHTVTIDFLNGFSGNPADAGRALYVNAITLDGLTTTENAAQMNVGAVNYTVTSGVATTAPKVTITAQVLADDTGASATDGITSDGEVTLTGTVTGEDGTTVEIYNGVTALGEADVSNGGWSFTTKLAAGTYALYALATDPAGDTATSAAAATITVETTPPSVAFTTPAQTLTASGTTAAIVLTGTVSAAAGTVVQILDGTTLLGTATLNGDTWSYDASLAIGSHNLSAVATDPAGNTTSTVDEITVDAAAAATTGGTDTLVLDVAGIAASGTNAQFTVSVDGTQIGGVQTVTAAQVAGGGQDITLTGNFGPAGPQTVTVTYLDGFTGAAADAGRTLYVDAVSLDGLTIFPNSTLLFDGSTSYSLQKSATPVVSDAGSADTLVVNLSEAAASGHDVLFMVSVDGQLVGGIQTVTASEAAGQSQNLTLTGDFGSGAHTVTIDFLNGFSGNPADAGRALYVNAITLDGLTTTENAAQMNVGAVNYTVTSGAATTAPKVTIPTVAFTTPAETLTASGTTAAIVLTGTVSAAAGTVVQILDGTILLGTATLSGDTWSYDASLTIGSHKLTAVATDPAGDTTTSAADAIVVDAPAAPSVNLTGNTSNNIGENGVVVYNWNPATQLQEWIVAETAVADGTPGATAEIVTLGDSTTAGTSFTNGSANLDYRPTVSWPAQLTNYLAIDSGITTQSANDFGDVGSPEDTRMALLGNATVNYGLQGLGGGMVQTGGVGDGLESTLLTAGKFNQLTLGYYGAGGTVTITALGGPTGSYSKTVTLAADGNIDDQTVSLPSGVYTGAEVTATGSTPTYLEGVSFANAASPAIQVFNGGIPGAWSSSLTEATTGASDLAGALALDPSLVLIDYGINDIIDNTATVPEMITNVANGIDAVRSIGADPIIVLPQPFALDPYLTSPQLATFDAFRAAVEQLAITDNAPVIDLSATYGDSDMALDASGLQSSDPHPSAALYQDMGERIASLLTGTADSFANTANFTVAGTQTVTGTSGNDILFGNSTNNILIGDGGSDTFIMNANDETDTIINNIPGSTAPLGLLAILGANHNQLWFMQSGQNLVVDVLGTSQQTIVRNWYGGYAGTQLQEIQSSDGLEIDSSSINGLVQAMANFSAADLGFNPTMTSNALLTDPAFAGSLANAVASAWHAVAGAATTVIPQVSSY